MLISCLVSAFVLQAPPRIDYTVSWVGNSYSGNFVRFAGRIHGCGYNGESTIAAT